MIILFVGVFIGAALYEVPSLVKKRYWRELMVFLIFFMFAFILGLLQTIGIRIPSPMKGIEYLFKNILHISYE